MERGLRRDLLIVAVVAAASLALRAAFALSTDLLQDEALYAWTGSQGIGFCPHPPALPVMIRLGQVVFGRGMLALRWGPLLWGTVAIALAYLAGRELYGGRAGVWAAGLLAACPIFVAAGTLAVPDGPLAALWLLAIFVGWRALKSGRPAWWLAAGLVLAAGLYTKYMMVLAVPAALAAMLATPEGRAQLRRPWPWAGVLLGVGLFAPVFLLWNSRNNWAAVRYHLVSRQHWTWKTDGVPEYVFGHLLFISPVLCAAGLAALVWAWRRGRAGDARGAWVAAFGLVPILFFLAPCVFTERFFTREHWDAIGYLGAILALAGWVSDPTAGERSARRRLRWGKVALGVAAVLSVGALLAGVLSGPTARLGMRPAMYRTLGWRELARHVDGVRRAHGADQLFLMGDSWITALCLDFYLGNDTHVYALPDRRNARYGLVEELQRWGLDWHSMVRDHAGQDGLFVEAYSRMRSRADQEPPPAGLQWLFGSVEPAGQFYVERGGRRLKRFGLFICRGLRADVGGEQYPAE